MSYLYILSVVFLIIGFMLFKKSNNKLNLIKWICISFVSLYAYNIVVCMILGILHITQHIWLLSIINFAIGLILLCKTIIKHEYQKYRCSKLNIISILLVLIIFGIMFVKDLYIYKGDVTHVALDSAIHYRAAEHYSEKLQLFVFIEDKTFFNFNIMQTGAYINDGILMNIVNDITGLEKIYVYQIFETLTMFAGGLALYAFFADRIKTKKGLIGTTLLFALYIYGYPYNSWFYGFSYLSVGITLTALMLAVVELLYSEENISKFVIIPLIGIIGFGLIFSYCLFVPAVFASICIYVFIKELQDKESKKYLKIFGKNTLIITGILLLVTAFGIGYLFIPSFLIEGQKNLISALKEEGGIYPEKYVNFIAYIPFAIIFIIEFLRRIKQKQIRFLDLFSSILILNLVIFAILNRVGLISLYYMIKLYFAVWIVVFAITIDILNNNIDNKLFRADVIIIVALFCGFIIKDLYKQLSEDPNHIYVYENSLKSVGIAFIALVLLLFTTLPEKLKKLNFIKIEPIKVTPLVYVVAVFCFINGWTIIKSGNILGENEKHLLPNLVGIYYDEHCEYRKARDVISNFNSNNILITKYARENLEDMTADNTLLITEDPYRQIWAMATLEYTGKNVNFRQILKYSNQNNIEDAIENENIKYIVRLDPRDENKTKECKNDIKQLKEIENTNILYSNENGYVAQIR